MSVFFFSLGNLGCVILIVLICFFFFFKQKTAYEMRISDWSSDVCSSDLQRAERRRAGDRQRARARARREVHLPGRDLGDGQEAAERDVLPEIGRASCRERVCQYV